MTTTADVTPLDRFLQHGRQAVEQALAGYASADRTVPAVVADAMRYSLLAGGKRLRPLLTLAAADACASRLGIAPSAAQALALPAACALEMIHTYSLIHDDLPAMDDDTLRRGRATLHVVAGDGMAILAGDGLQAMAFSLLAREPAGVETTLAARKLRVLQIIADAAGPAGMVGGQAIDLAAIKPAPHVEAVVLDGEAVQAMHARKTGALIRAAAVAGAVMVGASDAVVDAVDRFAAEVGLGFQIVDDILDVEAESGALGKTAGKDSAAGKPTYPALYGLTRSHELARACLERATEALRTADLADSHLAGLGRLAVARRS